MESTVPMFSPDGQLGDVPHDRTSDAVKAGFKIGQDMVAPNGKPGVIPVDSVHDAIKAGFSLASPSVPRPSVDMQESNLGRLYAGQPSIQEQQYRDQHPTLAKITDVSKDAAVGPTIGLAKAAGSTAIDADNLVRHVLNKTGVYQSQDDSPQTFGLKPGALEPKTAGEKVGAFGENVLEFVAGDEVLKGLTAAEKYKTLSNVAKLLEDHPTIAKLAHHGLTALRQSVVGTAQSGLHGAGLSEALETGGITGGLSAGLGAAGEAIGALKPGIKEIAGETIPVRASQEPGIARTAENAAGDSALQKFDVQQTQPAAKRAIGNVASDVANTARSRTVPNDSQAAISKLQRIMSAGKVNDFADAAKAIKAEAQPVFRKLDDLTAGEDMKFSDWQKSERSALRRGDYEAATKARSAQENLLQKYSDHFDPNDLSTARANWRQASALEDIDSKLNTKGILQPTPEALRKTGVPDPGVLNGKAFSKQILALRENGSLKAAGLTPEHIQSLADLGTLMERGNVAPSQLSQLVQLAGKVSKKVSGAQFVVGKLMTSPTFAANLEGALKSNASTAVVSKLLTAALGTADEDEGDGNDKPSTENGQTDQPAARNPQKSSGGSPIGAVLAGGRL
jgi:hypothetical protein